MLVKEWLCPSVCACSVQFVLTLSFSILFVLAPHKPTPCKSAASEKFEIEGKFEYGGQAADHIHSYPGAMSAFLIRMCVREHVHSL